MSEYACSALRSSAKHFALNKEHVKKEFIFLSNYRISFWRSTQSEDLSNSTYLK